MLISGQASAIKWDRSSRNKREIFKTILWCLSGKAQVKSEKGDATDRFQQYHYYMFDPGISPSL